MELFQTLEKQVNLLKQQLFTLYFAYKDPRLPWHAKVVTALVVGYALSPIDLIPDFIPVLGYVDDLILIPLGISLALKLIPSEVLNEARLKSKSMVEKPVNWLAGFLIILFWVFLISWVIYRVFF